MTASWVRREFGGIGVTQYRPGPHLAAVQEHFRGTALLCIDVSGSMAGAPIAAAIEGGLDFLREAEHAGYRCGLLLWNTGVAAHIRSTGSPSRVRARLRGAVANGGTDLLPALLAATKELSPLPGDRVICVFGDGAVGNVYEVEAAATRARELGIRFVVRGLGTAAGTALTRALTPGADVEAHTMSDVSQVRQGIASMAADVRRGHRPEGTR